MSVKILIVEDEEMLRETIATYFEYEGFEMMLAGSGDEAIDMMKSCKPDIIMSDIKMPNGDGVSLLKHVREQSPEPPPYFIMMSGFSEFGWDELNDLGANDYVIKPFDIEKLSEKIKAIAV